MRWPWQPKVSADRLVLSWASQTLAYVQATSTADGGFALRKMGVLRQGADSIEDFLSRVEALGLHGGEVFVLLRAEQYQLLQIEAPAVPPEELRQAARYQIRDMVDTHIDDLTIDVLKVGDGQQKGGGSLYVVVAPNAVIRDVQAFCQGMQWNIGVIDIQDMAHRNLQSAVAARGPQAGRATATLIISGDKQALLTICAHEELFYSRRLDLPEGFLEMDWGGASPEAAAPDHGYTPVGEYVPDYAAGAGASAYDYGSPAAVTLTAAQDGAQRLLVEVQRSLDLWDRTWSALPLAGLSVSAGSRSAELATWLGHEMGQQVGTLDHASLFEALPDAEALSTQDAVYCLPLLGALLRVETKN